MSYNVVYQLIYPLRALLQRREMKLHGCILEVLLRLFCFGCFGLPLGVVLLLLLLGGAGYRKNKRDSPTLPELVLVPELHLDLLDLGLNGLEHAIRE